MPSTKGSKALKVNGIAQSLHFLINNPTAPNRDRRIKSIYRQLTKAGWRVKHFNNYYKHLYGEEPLA